MSCKGNDEEKKLISEYVYLSNEAKKLYKAKKYKEALEKLELCEKKCNDQALELNVNVVIIMDYAISSYLTVNQVIII